jgi:hypothetical protein
LSKLYFENRICFLPSELKYLIRFCLFLSLIVFVFLPSELKQLILFRLFNRERQLPRGRRDQICSPASPLGQIEGGPSPDRHRQLQAHVPLPQVRRHAHSRQTQAGKSKPFSNLGYSV